MAFSAAMQLFVLRRSRKEGWEIPYCFSKKAVSRFGSSLHPSRSARE